MTRRVFTLTVTAVVMLILAAAIAGCASEQAGAEPTLAAVAGVDGAALLQERCSVCHSPDMSTHAGKTKDSWERTVTTMIGKGAQLTDAEKLVLVDYLAATYAP